MLGVVVMKSLNRFWLMLGLAGLIVLKSLWLIILTMPAVMIGNRVGYRLFKKLDGNDYGSLALGCLFIMGGLLMLKNLSSIN